MQIHKTYIPGAARNERLYIAAITLREFRGQENVDVQLFRANVDPEEIDALRGKNLVGLPDPETPQEFLAGATEDAALGCLLESFTQDEAEALAEYMQSRYGEQIASMDIAPLPLPVPLGVGPLAKIPEGEHSGFMNFDRAPDYPLTFAVRGYYELS